METTLLFFLCCFTLINAHCTRCERAQSSSKCDVKGTLYRNNEEFKSNKNFIHKCIVHSDGWRTEFVACLTEKGQRVYLGSSVNEGNVIYKCYKNSDGQIEVSYEESPDCGNCQQTTPTCAVNGETYKNNEEYQSISYVHKCIVDSSGSHTEIVACLTPNKERLEVGSSVTEDSWTYKCHKKWDGKIEIRNVNAGIATTVAPCKGCQSTETLCTVNGVSYRKNEEFKSGSYVYRCTEKKNNAWCTIPVACQTPNGQQIDPGSSITEGSWLYKCVTHSNGHIVLNKEYVGNKTPEGPQIYKCNGTRTDGEEWRSGNFIMKCTASQYEWIVDVIACLINDGRTRIYVGHSRTEGKYTYVCRRDSNGTVSLTNNGGHCNRCGK